MTIQNSVQKGVASVNIVTTETSLRLYSFLLMKLILIADSQLNYTIIMKKLSSFFVLITSGFITKALKIFKTAQLVLRNIDTNMPATI